MKYGLLLLMAAAACSSNGQPMHQGCDPTTEACEYDHDFGLQAVVGGQETINLCQSWTLHNATELLVNTVELDNTGGYHHSNWFVVPDNNYDVPDGAWPCADHNFDELTAAILGGVLFAQSTQSTHEIQAFPAGAVVRVPPSSRVIGETHILNTGDADISTDLSMKIQTLPPAMVTVKLAPFRLTYHDLHIPPMASSEFGSSCDVKATYAGAIGGAFSFKLYYALPHFHTLASKFQLSIFGGPSDGTMIFADQGWGTAGFGKAFDPPIDLAAANGFSFTCGYTNPRSAEVGWGNGDQEMCVMLGFADSAMAFDASVQDGTGAVTGMDGAATVSSGPCKILGFPFSQDK